MNKEKHILLVVGKSGAGKSTLVDILSKTNNWSVLQSYTTRKPRYDGEQGHEFVSKEEFDRLENKCAYTMFSGNEYCATSEQVDESNLYIIDPAGIEFFIENYKGRKKPYVLIVDCDEEVAVKRMTDREGGTAEEALKRALHDKKVFENLTDTLIEYDVPFISVENNGSEDDLTAAANIVTKHLNRTGVSL